MSSSYIVVVIGIVLAKAIGFLRDIVFASFFGTSGLADIYLQIYSIVNLIFAGVGIALSTLLIKNLNKDINYSENNQRQYVSFFLKRTMFYLLIATVAFYILARPLVKYVILPGISGDLFETAVKLTYIMIPSMFSIIIAYIISGVLQNKRVFFITSIVSLPYNVLIISTLFFHNVSIYAVALATTIGWFLHIVVQLPAFYKQGFNLFIKKENQLTTSFSRSPEVIWIFVSNLMFQLCFFIDKACVSGNEGMVATLNYASNLFVTISSVFVVAMSTVVFPSISRNYEEGNLEYVRNLVRYMLVVMFAIFIPFLLIALLFGEPLISLLYERGEFSHASTIITALSFALYSFSIFGYVAQELFNKILYLASKYKYTLVGTVVIVALNLIADKLLIDRYGALSAVVSTAILLTCYAVFIGIVLKKVIGNYFNKNLIKNIVMILCSALSAFLVYLIFIFVLPSLATSKFLFIVPLLACGVVYVGMLLITGVLKSLFQKINKTEQA